MDFLNNKVQWNVLNNKVSEIPLEMKHMSGFHEWRDGSKSGPNKGWRIFRLKNRENFNNILPVSFDPSVWDQHKDAVENMTCQFS